MPPEDKDDSLNFKSGSEDGDDSPSKQLVADFLSRLTSAILDPEDGIYIKLDRMQAIVSSLEGRVDEMSESMDTFKEELSEYKVDAKLLKQALENYDKNRRWSVSTVTLLIGMITVVIAALSFIAALALKYLEKNTLW